MENVIDLTVTSSSELIKNYPELRIKVISYPNTNILPCIAFERKIEDIQLNSENIKILIKALTDLLQ